MAYHTIVVHLDGGANSAVRTGIALRLAREHGSHLIGLAPTGEVEVPIDIGAALIEPGYLIATRHHLREAARLICEEFEAQAKAAGLSSYESRVDEADHAASVIAQARTADLAVIGQTDRDAPGGLVNRDLPERVALGCGRPVLVIPYVGRYETIGHRALGAWNDSRESARAFADALPLLQRSHRLTVLMQRTPQDPVLPTHGLEAWLTRQGVKTVHFAHEVSTLDVGDLLLSRAADLEADLIVMGAWGHSRLAEWVLGGATRTLLEQMTVPVLMAH